MKRIAFCVFAVMATTFPAYSATFTATGTLSFTDISGSPLAGVQAALESNLINGTSFSWSFDVNEAAADTDADPNKGDYANAVSDISFQTGTYDFNGSSTSCSSAVDCRIGVTNQSFGPGFDITNFLLSSGNVASNVLANDLAAAAGLSSSFYGASATATLLDDGVPAQPTDALILPTGFPINGSFSLFLLGGFGNDPVVRADYTISDLSVTRGLPPVTAVPVPAAGFMLVFALGSLAMAGKKRRSA